MCYEGLGLARIDRDSKLKWYWDGAAHHDFELRDVRVYTLAREARYLPYLRISEGVVEDSLCTLDVETGAELRRVSIYEALFTSRWSDFLAVHARRWRRLARSSPRRSWARTRGTTQGGQARTGCCLPAT
ncbi:MAG: hypothetical protein R3F17_03815 [Planctomycetota bacterium]